MCIDAALKSCHAEHTREMRLLHLEAQALSEKRTPQYARAAATGARERSDATTLVGNYISRAYWAVQFQ
jgi:hypothetical protein